MPSVARIFAVVLSVLAACGAAFDPARLELSTLSRGGTSVTMRDDATGVVFTVGSELTGGGFTRRGALRHLHLVAMQEGNTRGQLIDIVSRIGEATDPRVLVEALTDLAASRGRITSRSARFHQGHPAMVLVLDEIEHTEEHEGHALIVSDGRVAVMLTDILVMGSDASGRSSERFFAGLTMPGTVSGPAAYDD